MLKFSLVTPSYNQAQFLEQTIDSVLSQGYPNLEYIIIDGGSTDGSAEIIRRYERHLAYWVSEPDRGQSHAINKGLAKSTGEIQGWLNSDDMLADGALQTVAQLFQEQPNVDLCVGQRVLTDVHGNPIALHNYDFRNMFLDMLAFLFYPAQECCFWRSNLQRRVGLVREDLHYSMDFEWFLRLSRAGRPIRIDQRLGICRSHPEQKGNFREESGETLFRIRDEFLKSTGIPLPLWKAVIHAYRGWCRFLKPVELFSWSPAPEIANVTPSPAPLSQHA